MRYRSAYNATDRPVVVDDEGHIIAGGEWGVADAASEASRSAEGRNELVYLADDDLADGADSGARASLERARLLEGRFEAFSAVDKDELLELGRTNGLVDDEEAGGVPHKRDLAARLAEATHVDTPTSAPKPRTRRSAGATEEDS